MANQEEFKIAKVPGVLLSNNDIREETLRHIYWRDNAYTSFGEGLLQNLILKNRDVSPVSDGKSLLDFTHDGDSTLSAYIRNTYGTADSEVFEISADIPELHKWAGDYRESFDTHNRLGQVGDIKYAEGMTLANYANSDRKISQKYITPGLAGFYGSSNVVDLANRFSTLFNSTKGVWNPDSGRISDIPETNVATLGVEFRGVQDPNNTSSYYLLKQYQSYENQGRYFPWHRNYYRDAIKNKTLDNEVFEPYIEGGNDFSTNKKYDELDSPNYLSKLLNDKRKSTADTLRKNGNINEDEIEERASDAVWELAENFTHRLGDDIDSVDVEFGGSGLLSKTNSLFKQHKIDTLIGRFHTSIGDGLPDKPSMTDTAIRTKYGNSHGRNLLKKNAGNGNDDTNGYDNPYCRVWTYHHQYNMVNKLIRPFTDGDKKVLSMKYLQEMNYRIRAHQINEDGKDLLDGGKYLADNTVLGENGFVNIAPSATRRIDIKKCMFSIENLAWKDVLKKEEYLSKEQQGPNGGRIMWFPPYDLDFQESVNVDWDQQSFIGRGEKVYTYKNTDRTGTLSFTMLIDHPGIIDVIKLNKNGIDWKDNGSAHNDILRFFAGCQQLLQETDPEDSDLEKDTNSDEGAQAAPENVTKIKFYVYFPNNYSGNHIRWADGTAKKIWEKNGPSDADWFKYLLHGHGTDVVENSGKIPDSGYEVKTSGGLDVGENTIYPNPYSKECTQWVDREEENKKQGPYNYRVDFDLRQIIANKNYTDNASFQLNSKLNEEVSKDANFSFAEVVLALLEFDRRNLKDTYQVDVNASTADTEYAVIKQHLIKNGAREDKINQLIEIFSSSSIASVIAKGGATLQDSRVRKGCEWTNNVLLAHRRARSAFDIVQKMLINRVKDGDKISYKYDEIEDVGKLKDNSTVNSKESKSQRYAVVEINLNAPETTKLSETDGRHGASYSGGTSGDTSGDTSANIVENNEDNLFTDENLADIYDVAISRIDRDKVTRYETEAEYFDKLKIDSPVIYKDLKEKFRYFTPAFHSISPEGFNARLTFLHQCTRQGHTIETSAKNGYSEIAGNLSFGRMPICVLRIGDFINTRIVINNVTINYDSDGIQWDLNPEGAGVQPMYAKISMGIVIIGGQSLEGPISRLQNAVSFDYYANAGVYDDRADRITISESSREYTTTKRLRHGRKEKKTWRISGTEEKYDHLWTPSPNSAELVDTKIIEKKKK